MQSNIQYGFNVHFGTGYQTILPDGWKLIETPDDWAIGISPDGQEYFLGKDKAYPRRNLPNGGFYIDLKDGVQLLRED